MRPRALAPLLLCVCLMACGADPQESGDSDAEPVAPSRTAPGGAGGGTPAGPDEEGLSPEGQVGSLKRREVERGIARQLAKGKDRIRTRSVRCPQDVPATKGAKTKCDLTSRSGGTAEVTVRITSASARNIRYSIRLDRLPD